LARYARLVTIVLLLLACSVLCAAGEVRDFEKGLTLRIEGKNAQAVEAFKRVLADSPTHVRALVQMGAALEDQGKWREAAQAYRRALEIDPRDGSAIRNLAQLASSRSMDTPIQAPNPSKEDLLRNGLRALESRDFDKASEIFRLSRGLFPADHRPLFYSAITLELQGKLSAAIAMYERTVETFPDYIPARTNLIVALISAGDRERAGGQAQKALDIMPDNPRVRYLARLLGKPPPPDNEATLSRRGPEVP
jgi:tetratricopeptide (TPR) repeat protein